MSFRSVWLRSALPCTASPLRRLGSGLRYTGWADIRPYTLQWALDADIDSNNDNDGDSGAATTQHRAADATATALAEDAAAAAVASLRNGLAAVALFDVAYVAARLVKEALLRTERRSKEAGAVHRETVRRGVVLHRKQVQRGVALDRCRGASAGTTTWGRWRS